MRLAKTKERLIASVFIGFPLIASLMIANFTQKDFNPWYSQLIKPSWNPPAWIFGPVWSLLYLMMGFASWRIWEQRAGPWVRRGLWLYGFQLIANFLWTPLFFSLHRPFWALIDIAFLLLLVVATRWQFQRIDKVAGSLLTPYLGWVVFAFILNLRLWQLNS